MPNPFGNDGMYWVGHDVPAGTYDIIGGYGDSQSMYIIYDGAGADANVISAQKINDESEIELHDGEFIEMRECFLMKK